MDLTPNDTDFVLPAEVDLPRELVSTRCPQCKVITPQEFVKLTPFKMDGPLPAMETLKITKRLIICTKCGNIRITN